MHVNGLVLNLFQAEEVKDLVTQEVVQKCGKILFVPSCRVIYCILSLFFPPKSHQSYASR